MVTECPAKWGWGSPAADQKKLVPLFEALAKLRHEGVTTAMVAIAFHKRSLLPLAQRVLPMWEMTPNAPLARTWMLEEPVPALEISLRVSRMVSSELKNYWVIPMRPDRDYISLVSHLHPYFCFIVPFFALIFIRVTICS